MGSLKVLGHIFDSCLKHFKYQPPKDGEGRGEGEGVCLSAWLVDLSVGLFRCFPRKRWVAGSTDCSRLCIEVMPQSALDWRNQGDHHKATILSVFSEAPPNYMRQCIHPLRQSRLCVLQGRMIKSIKTKKYRNQKGYFHQLADEDIVTEQIP